MLVFALCNSSRQRQFSGDPLVTTNRIRIDTLALSARLPTMHGSRERVDSGGIMSYGPNFQQCSAALPTWSMILRGTSHDIPVEQPLR